MSGSPVPRDFWLMTPAEVESLQEPPHSDALKAMLQWTRDFIAQPHRDRDAGNPDSQKAVCPFMPGSLDKGLTWFTLVSDPMQRPQDVIEAVAGYKEALKSLSPTSGKLAKFKTIIIVFPEISAEMAPDLIDGVHEAVAGDYKSEGMMLGEFHAGNQKCGSYNSDFFPLQSPVPAMAIRLMVAQDHVFLTRESGDPMRDLENLRAYARAIRAMDPPPNANVQEMAKVLLEQLESMARRASEVPPD